MPDWIFSIFCNFNWTNFFLFISIGKLSVCFLAFLITLCATAPTKKPEDKVISLLMEWIYKLTTSTQKAFEAFVSSNYERRMNSKHKLAHCLKRKILAFNPASNWSRKPGKNLGLSRPCALTESVACSSNPEKKTEDLTWGPRAAIRIERFTVMSFP